MEEEEIIQGAQTITRVLRVVAVLVFAGLLYAALRIWGGR
jgi:hypothetical protein